MSFMLRNSGTLSHFLLFITTSGYYVVSVLTESILNNCFYAVRS